MMRVALYARYSSDSQRDASIEDQLRICRDRAEREEWKVVATYKDAAISGASMKLRPGIQSLLQDAQRGGFNLVLAEAMDRISRDQADIATLFKHLRFADVSIFTLAEGEITELHVGLKGTMNALFLKDLAARLIGVCAAALRTASPAVGFAMDTASPRDWTSMAILSAAIARSTRHRPT